MTPDRPIMVCPICGRRMFDFSHVTDGWQHCPVCGVDVKLITQEEYDRLKAKKEQR